MSLSKAMKVEREREKMMTREKREERGLQTLYEKVWIV